MAELKTKPTEVDVGEYIAALGEPRRSECAQLREVMERVVGEPARMWGASMIGFGQYDYRYPTGNSGTWFLAGFAPRKQNLTLYIMAGFDQYDDLMARLGKHTTGKSCLYLKRLSDVDLGVLEELVRASVAHMQG